MTVGHLTDKSNNRVGHLNTTLDRAAGNLNDQIFKSSNAQTLPGADVEVDRHITCIKGIFIELLINMSL